MKMKNRGLQIEGRKLQPLEYLVTNYDQRWDHGRCSTLEKIVVALIRAGRFLKINPLTAKSTPTSVKWLKKRSLSSAFKRFSSGMEAHARILEFNKCIEVVWWLWLWNDAISDANWSVIDTVHVNDSPQRDFRVVTRWSRMCLNYNHLEKLHLLTILKI